MTKSTITRERLQEIAEDGFLKHGESKELARMALAAMASEPVAVCIVEDGQMCPDGFGVCDHSLPDGTHELYAAPQPAPVVPVVPAEMYWQDAPVDGSTRAAAYASGWNACRAAILAAAPQSPGSEPATVPGKWIPVSERMPEDRISVILWDAEIGEVTSGHYSHKTQTFYHCGDAIENEITHWMPPPCAPQEVK